MNVKRSAKGPVGSSARAVLEYLIQHPEAGDTVIGIARWWMLEWRIQQTLGEVKKALVELVASKLVVERRGRDGQKYYRLNRRRLEHAKSILSHES
jgi:hypothetical protein